MLADEAALVTVREHLDRELYALLDHRIGLELQRSSSGFPRFAPLRKLVERLDPAHRTMFRLFRLGEPVDDAEFASAFPSVVRDALCACGLVVSSGPEWRTPGLLVVPAQGLLLITGVPVGYPTAAEHRPHAVFDLSTSFVAAALPHGFAGRRVLDVCSGSGVQALLCAARGADEVVGVELGAAAVAIASANAVLNGLSDRVRFLRSDLLSAVDGEVFDFVVANLPYAPALPAGRDPSTIAEIGTSLVWPLVATLPAHLTADAQGIVATWRAPGRGRTTYQLCGIADRLAREGFAVSASVDPLHETVDGVLATLAAETDEAGLAHARTLLASEPVEYFANQLIRLDRTVRPVEPITFGLG